MRRYRAKLVLLWHLDFKVNLAGVAGIDDSAVGFPVRADIVHTDEESTNLLDGILRGGETYASDLFVRKLGQPLHRNAEVRPALVVGNGMELVDDEGAHVLQSPATALGGQENEERFGRRNEHMGRLLRHSLSLALGRISRSHGDSNVRKRSSPRLREVLQVAQGRHQVAMDIVRERLKRRDIDDLSLVRYFPLEALPDEAVEALQEGRQRLARPGRSRNERMPPLGDGGPSLRLRVRRSDELASEPLADEGMKRRERIVQELRLVQMFAHSIAG